VAEGAEAPFAPVCVIASIGELT